MILWIVPIALLASAPLALAETVSVELAAPKAVILVGEPLRCTAMWRASEATTVMPQRARVMIDRGAGFEEWRERRASSEASIEESVLLLPDRPWASTHIIAAGRGLAIGRPSISMLGFPEPGSYQVRIEYPSNPRVTSNSVTIRVVPPTEGDREIFVRYVRGTPDVLSVKAWEYRSLLAPAFAESRSVYLAWPYVNVMRYKLTTAIAEASGGYPVQGDVPALLTALAERDFAESPFDEDRVELLGQMQDRSGRIAEAIATFQRLIENYPNGQAARAARRRLDQLMRRPESTGVNPVSNR